MIELRRAILAALVAAAAGSATAQTPPAQPQQGGEEQQGASADAIGRLIDDLVAANRILVDQGVLDGYEYLRVLSRFFYSPEPDRFGE